MPSVRISAPLNYRDRLQSAFDIISQASDIWIKNVTLIEDPIFDKPFSVVLRGGYDAGFTNQTGYTTVDGIFLIKSGSLVMDRITIQ
jgi:hypothetical protein